jgi:hypothetical protein
MLRVSSYPQFDEELGARELTEENICLRELHQTGLPSMLRPLVDYVQ